MSGQRSAPFNFRNPIAENSNIVFSRYWQQALGALWDATAGLSQGGGTPIDLADLVSDPPKRGGDEFELPFTPSFHVEQDMPGSIFAMPIRPVIQPNIAALFDHFTDAGNVTTGETDLYSDTLLGQLANNGDKLQAFYGGIFVTSATATREIKLYFGGTAIFDTGTLTVSLNSSWALYCDIMRVDAATVRYVVSLTTEGAALAAYTASGELGSLTLGAANIMKITGQAAGVGAATNDIVAKLGSIQYIKAAGA